MLKVTKTRPTREESRAQTRERILASAREVFSRNGYDGASVDLIAENVGFSKGAFYSNFDSKESVFLTLLERHKEREIGTLEALLASSESLKSLFDRIREFYEQLEGDMDWGLLSAEFQMQAGRDPQFGKQAAKFYREQRAALGRLIKWLFVKAHKQPPAPAEELATIFIALALGLALQRSSDHPAIRKGLLGDAILLVLQSLLGEQ